MAAIVPFLAPLALIRGFRRGENAILPQGKRFVVFVRFNANVKSSRLIDEQEAAPLHLFGSF